MGIVGFLSKGFVHLIGMSASHPAGTYAFRTGAMPRRGDTAWQKRRSDRLECLCMAANAGPCCDSGPLIVAAEAMERNWLAERRDGQ